MSRSGYSYDYEGLELYRAAVEKAIKGKRGQTALRDLLQALDQMPEKKLIRNSFSCEDGVCSLGALAKLREADTTDLEAVKGMWGEYEKVDQQRVGKLLNIAPSMAAEIMFMNDEGAVNLETDEERWTRMRWWVVSMLRKEND